MNKLFYSLKESYNEMVYKVSWPKLKDLQSSSVLVLIGSLAFALVIGVMDTIFENLMREVYNMFN